MLRQKDFRVYVLNDYAVHLMPEVRHALFKIIGGNTGDTQINDTHYHHMMKSGYCDQEMELMLQQFEENPTKIPSTSRD